MNMPASVKKLYEGLLNAFDGKTALYDEEMNLFYTDYPEFYNNFSLKEACSDNSLKKETHLTVTDGKEKATLTVIPIYKGKRTVSSYLCVLKENYSIYKMMSCSPISDYVNDYLKKHKQKLNELEDLNRDIAIALEELPNDDPVKKLLARQRRAISSIIEENGYFYKTCFTNVEDSNLNCNLSVLFETICQDAENSLKTLKRKVTYHLDDKNYYTAKNYEPLITAFFHLIRYHLMLSPLKTGIDISTEYKTLSSTRGCFCITISTKLKPSKEISSELLTAAQAYRDLAKKVALFDYKGDINFTSTEKTLTSAIKIPALKKNRGNILTSKNSAYMKDGFRPFSVYMKDIIEYEINVNELAKMESSKSKKLAKLDE